MSLLEETVAQATKNNRVCPKPIYWNALYQLLLTGMPEGAGSKPASPLILAAWHESPAISKARRLNEHLNWAASHGVLKEVHELIASLSEDQWHHYGE